MKKILVVLTCAITALCIMSGSFAEWQEELTIKANITVKKRENPSCHHGQVSK